MVSSRLLKCSTVTTLLISLYCDNVRAYDWQLGYRVSSERYEEGNNLFFHNTENYLGQTVADFNIEHQGFRSSISAREQWRSENDNFTPEDEDKLIVGEFFLDTSAFDWDFTFGKKRLNWAVGFGHQPLNLITVESNLATGVVIDEGAWMISAERYSDSGAITLIAANSKTQQESNAVQPKGAGLRYYELVGDWDLQTILYHDDVHGMNLGGSAVTVVGDAMSYHLSTLWSEKYNKLSHSLSGTHSFPTSDPIQRDLKSDGFQFLTGVNYSFANNVNMIVEYWFDGRSASHRQWQDLFDAGDAQLNSTEGMALLSAEREFFTSVNLMRHNMLLHLSYDSEPYDIEFDLQISPRDKGAIGTARIIYEWSQNHRSQFGFRTYTGSERSVYRQLPNEFETFFRIEGAF
ncbi:hypothetical protein [Pleionea sp. CnH1-48]|uniref:hypothetical protein n=1 Tax=Pleionea sp. CnH1-48 TaxID=2954494 RepID=UPI0020968686|nr:hypothetical protein [Pleionea sp. CnH1-48]MCO7224337.1 hypothetical protein [Pleionea sp. CnH1-48]